MSHKPDLPGDIPKVVNGWVYLPESTYNGLSWYSRDGSLAVLVFDHHGDGAVAKVSDERAGGFESSIGLGRDIPRFSSESDYSLREMLEAVVEWMRTNPPETIDVPQVNEAVFDAPAGYHLEHYWVQQRDTVVYYERDGHENASARGMNRDEYPYIYVQVWRGSGNATVALSPWARAHDHQMNEVDGVPEEAGLDVALTVARRVARDSTDAGEIVADAAQVGQTALESWGDV